MLPIFPPDLPDRGFLASIRAIFFAPVHPVLFSPNRLVNVIVSFVVNQAITVLEENPSVAPCLCLKRTAIDAVGVADIQSSRPAAPDIYKIFVVSHTSELVILSGGDPVLGCSGKSPWEYFSPCGVLRLRWHSRSERRLRSG